MRPNFGNIEDVESVFRSVLLGHGLDEPVPAGVITLGDLSLEVVGGPLGVLDTLGGSLISSEALDTLSSLVVVLDVVNFVLVVNPSKGVGGVSVHVAVAIGGTTVGEQNSDLMEGLGGVGPEVEGGVGVLQVVNGVALLGVDEIGELNGVFNEENGCVVSDHIVVTFLGVMLDSETTGVTVTVVGTALTGDGRETEEDGGLLADLVEELGLAKMGNIMSYNALTVSGSALSVDNTLGDTLTSEVGKLVNQVEVGQDDGALGTGGH